MSNTMKKSISPRTITLIVIVSLLVTIIVLSSTVFTIQNIMVNPLVSNLSQISSESVLTNIEQNNRIPQNCSVLLFNKTKATAEIEADIPYIRIVNIEIEFPNIVKVNFVEREGAYYVPITNSVGTYAVLDNEFKVLTTTTSIPSTETRINQDSEFSDVVAGQFLNMDNHTFWTRYGQAFEMNSWTSSVMNTLFVSIEITTRISSEGERLCMQFVSRDNSTFTCIGEDLLEYKVAKLKQIISTIETGSNIDIYEASNGEIMAGNA